MKERPIIFSSPMVRAILEGRKTQTRRILKGSQKQPYLTPELLSQIPPPVIHGEWTQLLHPMAGKFHHGVQESADSPLTCVRTPFQPGMRLWVKETWMSDPAPCCDGSCDCRNAICRADIPAADERLAESVIRSARRAGTQVDPWKSPIFMPRWASRITLEITDVRVERLQDISEADCWAEGIGREGRPLEALFNLLLTKPKISIGDLALRMPDHFELGDDPKVPSDREKVTWVTPKGVYAALWESIHGPGSWDLNPWVFATSFRRIEGGPQ